MSNKIDAFGTSYSFNKVNEKNTIVFIHGVGLSKEIWDPQINFFKDYNTLTYDLLGHGKTPLKKSTINMKDFTRQLLRLINELKLSKINLIGFSLGALIARHFASEYNDKLNSLILLGSIYKRSEEQKIIIENRLEVAKMNKPASKKDALRRWLSENFSKKNPNIYKKIYSMLEKNNHDIWLKVYKLFVYHEDNDEDIKQINTKSLIITGENDIGSKPRMSENLSKLIARSEFKIIKKGKHLCNIECSENFNNTLKKFIDSNV